MRLYVYVLEAKGLPVAGSSYVKLQAGKSKSKTRTVKAGNDEGESDSGSGPVWNEEFVFRAHDTHEELLVSVYYRDEDESRLFHPSGYLLGRVRIPVCSVADVENQSLPPTWFTLEEPKTRKYTKKICGKVLLTLSLQGREDHVAQLEQLCANNRTKNNDEWEGSTTDDLDTSNDTAETAPTQKLPQKKRLMKVVSNRLERLLPKKKNESCKTDAPQDLVRSPPDSESCTDDPSETCSNFEEAMDSLISRGSEQEMPDNLEGGVLLDQTYMVSSKDLNAFLFAPESQFRKDLAQTQGVMDLQEAPWTWKTTEEGSLLTRLVTYTKPPSKMVKAVKATEEQSYIRGDGQEFAILVDVDTPDVPYGNTFRIQILYKLIPGPDLPSGDESSRLVISWGINFLHSTMMKGMIEGGARQGLKESFDQFSSLMSQNFKPLPSFESLGKDKVFENLQTEHQSDWELAIEYFWNLTVLSATVMFIYVAVHILLCQPTKLQGLEFNGLDLPDSFGEIITTGILVILLDRVHSMVSHFIEARLHMGSDHGLKAQGDGWFVTVALIEATNLPSTDSNESPDPFVILTCNGKTRTSSVQLQTSDPQWNERLEFDATDEPPSVLDVEVFNFDGPFDQAASLGNAEINFLKHTPGELADMWITLEGKVAVASQAKLHLRIFLENNKGVETFKDYLTKVEKEVGKKLDIRSPQKNSAFQKLFGLPPDEFLIKDYWCYLRQKVPLQGRLFLSARIVGFYSNVFGHKTKFFFLWEDIEDIEVQSPSLASVGSPTLVIVLRKGRGLDARNGARSQDDEGRLRIYLQSFPSFDTASRTIIALWRARTLAPHQKALLTEKHSDGESLVVPSESAVAPIFHADEDMSKIYSSSLSVDIDSLMKLFDGGTLEKKVMGKSGCLNYTPTKWEPVKSGGVVERQVSYKFNHRVSVFGGEVSCVQRKSPLSGGIADKTGWVITEVMVLHDIPFGDHFHVHLRYEIQQNSNGSSDAGACKNEVYLGVQWLKGSNFQQRITRNVKEKLALRLKEIFELVKKELLQGND